jgi:hypothetical protein
MTGFSLRTGEARVLNADTKAPGVFLSNCLRRFWPPGPMHEADISARPKRNSIQIVWLEAANTQHRISGLMRLWRAQPGHSAPDRQEGNQVALY